MQFSKTVEYGILILSYIAKHSDKKLSSPLLHQALNIPYKYLTKLVTKLSKAGLVHATKGRDGGIVLGKMTSEITIAHILEAMDEPVNKCRCVLGYETCDPSHPCILHHSWEKPRALIDAMIHKTTLEDLLLQQTSPL
ncbi:Rrf2 family transcriptional regulator [Sulfurospirillum sp. 'SP']|nr:Rrf2 family transcriptional regulator [Sulfurospirillum sp. 'SP']WNY99980.1 Rrf2 family transcriptional regulator [Sulfurospirillum sp. 'SP']